MTTLECIPMIQTTQTTQADSDPETRPEDGPTTWTAPSYSPAWTQFSGEGGTALLEPAVLPGLAPESVYDDDDEEDDFFDDDDDDGSEDTFDEFDDFDEDDDKDSDDEDDDDL